MASGGNSARIDRRRTAAPASLFTGWLQAAFVAGLPLIAMYVVSVVGLALVGVNGGAGTLLAAAASSVALAVGGSARPDASGLLVDVRGEVSVVPLTVSLVGVAVLGVAFVRVCRRSGVYGTSALAAALARVAVLLLGGLAVVALLGRHSLPTPNLPVPADLRDLGGLPLPDFVQAELAPAAGFHTDLGRTLGFGLLWLLVAAVIALLLSCGDLLGGRAAHWHARLRPLWMGLGVPVVGWLAAASVAIVVAGLPGDTAQHLGLMLLGLPNVAWMLFLLALFVPLQISATVSAEASLPHLVRSALHVAGHKRASLTLPDLARLDGRAWILPVVAAVLIVAGSITIVWLQRESSPTWHAGLLAGTLTGTSVALALLTGISVTARLSVADIIGSAAGLTVHADLLLTAAAGLVWGAAAGIVGALVSVTALDDRWRR